MNSPPRHAGSDPRPRRAATLAAWALGGVLAATGLGLGYDAYIKDNVFPRNFGVVEPGEIYRSGRLTPAATEAVVKAHGIRTIVDLGAYDKDPVAERIAQRTAKALGVTRHVFRLQGDGTGDPTMYVAALRLMADPANRPILVHCSAGSERTSACVMMYRAAFQDRPFDDTFAEALAHKHDPDDNPEMRGYLTQYGPRIIAAVKPAAAAPAAAAEAPAVPALPVSPPADSSGGAATPVSGG